jgi:hypothetical protein
MLNIKIGLFIHNKFLVVTVNLLKTLAELRKEVQNAANVEKVCGKQKGELCSSPSKGFKYS